MSGRLADLIFRFRYALCAIIAVGFVTSFIAAVFVVRSLLGYVANHGYALFGWWRLVVGTLGLVALLTWG